ncbi:MAG: hypothetical protein JRH13_09400 [Deltaproteobacteria bacterium]|nr:hypothetical protein [Deltaproteobacteria bacterium]MBW2016952.1 hypothetical protein [Deltaproteobacteria bacterium]MBW2129565.1 hypothetical protein [Deltaproteobacteria bacterium]MBW2302436.1 hypothetical protein [Deltaproteobacteria bacterium]
MTRCPEETEQAQGDKALEQEVEEVEEADAEAALEQARAAIASARIAAKRCPTSPESLATRNNARSAAPP